MQIINDLNIHTNVNIAQIKDAFITLQNNICNIIENNCENNLKDKFISDQWKSHLGTGESRIIENGNIIEKGGVNFSEVKGTKLPPSALEKKDTNICKKLMQILPECEFHAMGVSIVIHPKNPFIPTTHFNIRFFMVHKNNEVKNWWFGGGYDLTPYFAFQEDIDHWQNIAKNACDKFDKNYYPKFKAACDEYFYLPHRQEPRGIGGLFFDNFNDKNFNFSFDFAKNISESFIQAYIPILSKRKNTSYSQIEKDFQKYRRGRYVEFNLLYDRGTLFGLQSKGRTESILMSMPPEVIWDYIATRKPEFKQMESNLLNYLNKQKSL